MTNFLERILGNHKIAQTVLVTIILVGIVGTIILISSSIAPKTTQPTNELINAEQPMP